MAPYPAHEPALGRWLNRDPIGEAGGINLYGYVGDNPLNWIDSTGLIAPAVAAELCAMNPACAALAANAAHQAVMMSLSAEAGLAGLWAANNGTDSNVPANVGPGPNAGESAPTGPSPRPTKEQQDKINELGNRDGCHTCGTKDPGTKSGNWIGDHQDPTTLNPEGKPQKRYYPQCRGCNNEQGVRIRWIPDPLL